jgi:hypothetical protein
MPFWGLACDWTAPAAQMPEWRGKAWASTREPGTDLAKKLSLTLREGNRAWEAVNLLNWPSWARFAADDWCCGRSDERYTSSFKSWVQHILHAGGTHAARDSQGRLSSHRRCCVRAARQARAV